MFLEWGVRCGSGERCRFQQNWFVLTTYCTLVGFAYSSALPSLHQFVTSSTHPEDSDVQPGLGLSETWYSWVVSVLSIGELTGAVVISILLRWVYTKYLMLSSVGLAICGGVLYSIGRYGWMVLIGRFLIGVFMGVITTLLRAYIGETSSTVIASMPSEKREKATLKYTAFFVTFGVCAVSVLSGPGVAAIIAQIPGIDQFRWPGYFAVVHALILGVGTLVGFREKKGDIRRGAASIKCRDIPIPIYTVACLIGAFFVVNWYFAVFETLLNPVMADNFGFDVEFDSYAFFGTLFFFVSGIFILYVCQRCYVDNRITCLCGLILALSGSLIATDWQSLRGDPCDQFSDGSFNISLSSEYNINASGSGAELCDSENEEDIYCIAEKSNVDLTHCIEDDDDDIMLVGNASCLCEAFSDAHNYHCFWNPHSRVTGRDCERCAKLCRSHDRSLNLVQFLIGISIVSSIIVIGRISITVIVSDALAGESQALIMGILVAMGAMARFTGPLWGNAAYLAADHRVYIVMNILSVSMLLVIVFYCLLYRTMKPASGQHTHLRTSDSVTELELHMNTNEHDIVKEVDAGKLSAVNGLLSEPQGTSEMMLLLDNVELDEIDSSSL